MRNRLKKASEVLVNVSIVGVAILLGIVLVKNYLLPDKSQDLTDALRISRGTRLSIPNVDWSKANQTVLLVLSDNCRYCTDSAPFYKRLVEQAGERGSRVIAALPEDLNTSKAYLNRLGVSVADVLQADPSSLGTRATPTVLLLDHSGIVKDVWVGQLSPEKEHELLGKL
ncbi:MAG TPA: hypothetical protein VFR78_10865 [Pyrinomonadaceae bacterium]|nr:hypothetical protein [Pyrinomonadaceae bacterium]